MTRQTFPSGLWCRSAQMALPSAPQQTCVLPQYTSMAVVSAPRGGVGSSINAAMGKSLDVGQQAVQL